MPCYPNKLMSGSFLVGKACFNLVVIKPVKIAFPKWHKHSSQGKSAPLNSRFCEHLGV